MCRRPSGDVRSTVRRDGPMTSRLPKNIVPRWEWRTFGRRFAEAEDRLAEITPYRTQQSDELYLLSASSTAAVKVRDRLMDVKQLERVDRHGLERWRPTMKAPFPLPAPAVREVMSVLVAGEVPLARSDYTLDQLLAEVVGANPDLATVDVHKRRAQYDLAGCTAELTDLRTEQGSTRTLAVESEEPARVLAALRELGVESLPNVSYPRELKGLIGLGGRRFAAIDVGTNSVKFHIGERRPDGTWQTVADRAVVTRLGAGLDETGRPG